MIMAGGSGTRFWPVSRAARPKQLLDLADSRTMIRNTFDRLSQFLEPERIHVVTNRKLMSAIGNELPMLPGSNLIGEPFKRDTAPCIGLAAHMLLRKDPEATMVVLPADHVIEPEDMFVLAIKFAEQMVEMDPRRLVTFGIKPAFPSESYGYIERGQSLTATFNREIGTFAVKQFREKPDIELAKQYVESGNFYWNSGIFVWKAKSIVEELARHAPDLDHHLERIVNAVGTDDYETVLADEFEAIQAISIDYAVMEKASDVVVIEAPFHWDDVGSWQSLSRLHGTNGEGNTNLGRHLGIDTRGTITRSEKDHLIVTIGMEDTIIVHTENATLVANKNDEEAVRKAVKLIESEGWQEYL